MATKQVIVMRTDLNMRKGKMIAQGSHASMAFLTREGKVEMVSDCCPYPSFRNNFIDHPLEIKEWMENSFTKVCLQIGSEAELDEIYNKAKEAGLTVHMVIDSGRTEFNGVPTKTFLAIGPHFSEKIDKITGNLKLL
jgi:PTH2 family peptidyl-tRNA hydrolase